MKKESGKDNKERREIRQTEQTKCVKSRKNRETEQKKERQESQEKRKEKSRLYAAISLGVGTLLFSAYAFSGNERGYTNVNGYMAFQKAKGEDASVGVLVSEDKVEKNPQKNGSDAIRQSMQSELQSETESETDTELGSETESEIDTESSVESEMKTAAELEKTDGETETQSETYPETEPQTDKEADTEEESTRNSEEGSEGESEMTTEETEKGTEETSTEKESEEEEERGTEGEPETQTEIMTEEGTERGTEETSGEKESEKEEERGTEREPETQTEIMTEEGMERETERHTEEASNEKESEEKEERDTEKEPKTETEVATEKGTEGGKEEPAADEKEEKERAQESETEKMTESVTEAEPETTPSFPEPVSVYRGEQYEIRGDENAWYRDETGRLWVRKGSSVYVDPAKQQGYTQGGSVTDVQQDGMLTFQLKKTDERGIVIGVSRLQQEAYFVDGEAPEARIEPSGNPEDGVIYAAQSSAVTVTVPPDGKSGLKRVSYRIGNEAGENSDSSSESETWTDCRGGEQLTISEEGIYRVYVRTEDRVGNLAFSSSAPICVDCTPPQIEIEGVQGETANSGSVPIRVSCSDSFYRRGSLAVKIVGANNGKVPKIKSSEEKEKSASTEFFDFPKEQTYDDAYRLEVRAEDLAGNVTQKTLDFSINRFGSVYDLSGETKEALKSYYLTEATDIVFLEMNIDYVGESEIFCRENGELKKLNRGSDYTVALQGSSDSWKQYRYTIPASYFEKEGVYELLLSSKDRAENESDTGLQGKQVTFALDWTAPECLITGVEPLGVYQGTHQTACVQPKDNLGIQVAKIYYNSELMQTVERNDTPVKLKLDEKQEWQTLQVYVQDFAGNEFWSPEIPVFVSDKTEGVLPYEKTRKSAQEKEEELIRRKAGYGGGKDQNAADSSKEKKDREEAAESEKGVVGENSADRKKKYAGDGSLLERMERIRRGRLLLIFGTILFVVTFLVCILPVGRRKK